MNVTISTQILSGNLGDGWKDQNAAATALGDYLWAQWNRDLQSIIVEGHSVTIDIDVCQDTSGSGHDVSVWAESDADSMENEIELAGKVERTLTPENEVWEKFCSSPLAEGLSE